jgi:hypothetical protein
VIGGDDIQVRIEGMNESTFKALVASGICPLCGLANHQLVMCPLLPEELVPFC